MNNLPTDVKRIQVNVIKETLNQPSRKIKLDENGMLAIRLHDGSVALGTLVASGNDIRVMHEIDPKRLPRVVRVMMTRDPS